MILKTAGILSRRFLFTTATTKMSSTAKKLDGRIAIVTASTDGIGFAIAKRLAADGAQVVVSSRKQKNVDAAVAKLKMEGLTVTGMVCHVGLKEDREKLIEKTVSLFGGLDILISNAAVNPVFGPVLSCPEDAWDKIFDINVKTAFLLAKSAVPHMEKRGKGSIIFISSIAGFQPFSALGAYSVSKTALLGLTKVLAQEVGHSGIRVNCIAPGVIQTKFSSMLVDNDAVRNKVLEGIPLQRIGQPEDMGGLASFLCSDDASFITGENIIAAGGAQSRL
ncbi:dehydrogenase/reductase SDR family member 4-like [Daphnia carinata]|uniref:dehydrogenase/reductase SDR family member 4-like n=1 Tax=Daphnia carinata TaxID=120202 RepID=UPI00257B881B|nr:dehydrogenase/reductase SDR family member 4-like [Daphnia carinata]